MKVKVNKLLAILVLILILPSCNTVSADDNTSTSGSSDIVYFPLDEIKSPKDETIYVNLDLNGTVNSINVVNRLEGVKDGYIKDYGYFINALNLTSNEEIVIDEEMAKIPVIGEHDYFYYQTSLGRGYQLPFNLKTTIYLNDKEVDPFMVVGKKGQVKLEIEVTSNPNSHPYFYENYLCQIQLSLPIDQNTIISSEKATKVLVGRNLNLAYMVLPTQSAKFSLIYNTNKFEYQGLTATYSLFSFNDILGFDVSLIPDYLSLLIDGMEEMKDGQVLLKDGLVELFNGLSLLSDGMQELANGSLTLTNEAKAFFEGVREISFNLDLLNQGLNELASNGQDLNNGYQQIVSGINSFLEIVEPLLALNPTARELITQLRTGLNEYGSGLSQYVEGVNLVAENLSLLNEGMKLLAENSILVEDGMALISEGNEQTASAMLEIVNGTKDVPSQLDLMVDGQTKLIEAIKQALPLLENIPISSEQEIVSFTSVLNEKPRSVQFIIQQEGALLLNK